MTHTTESRATALAKWKARASAKHNNFYDYSESKYINARTKIKIRCRVHGVFEQLPHSHIYGRGCPGCKKDAISESRFGVSTKRPRARKPPVKFMPLQIMDQLIRDRLHRSYTQNTCVGGSVVV